MIRRTVTLLVALSILVPAAASACAMYYEPAPKLVAKKAEPAKVELTMAKVQVPDPDAGDATAEADEPQKAEPAKIVVEDGAGLAALMADLDGLLEPADAPAEAAAVAKPAPEAPAADADPAAKAPRDKARQAPRQRIAKPAPVAQR